MYRTCVYCVRRLGDNQLIEPLPIGRRVAFDAAQGRLWVVCPTCVRWNLVPFDRRFEAIEACERQFHDTSQRFSTGNIGLARTREGLELVRIGKALPAEEIAWRYGDEFQRRYRRRVRSVAGGGLASLAAVGGLAAVLPAGGGAAVLTSAVVAYTGMLVWLIRGGHDIRGRIPLHEKTGGIFTRADLAFARVRVMPDDTWNIRAQARPRLRGRRVTIADATPRSFLAEGARITEVLGQLVPALNRGGARSTGYVMREARQILDRGDVLGRMPAMSARAMPAGIIQGGQYLPLDNDRVPGFLLGSFPRAYLLALEITLHGDRERDALAGELAWLERQWREADALAAIADGLAIPDDMAAQFAALRERAR